MLRNGQYAERKNILYTICRYNMYTIQYKIVYNMRFFSQNIQYTYTLRVLENIQYTLVSKIIFNILSEHTLKNY